MPITRFRSLAFAACALASLAFSPSFASSSDRGLPNFHTVAPDIYRGGRPTVVGLQKLKAMGVKTIVDLEIAPKTVRKEGKLARSMGFTWINLPMGAEAPTTKEVNTMMATFRNASASPVYVHCQHGADRTGCMVGVWRVTHDHWTYARAFKEMRKYGFNPRWVNLSGTVHRYVGRQN